MIKIIIGGALIILGLIILIIWHSKKIKYQCPKCKKKFKLSFFKDLVSPHWPSKDGGYKYTKCLFCKNYVKAREINK